MKNPEKRGSQGDASPGLPPPLEERGDHPPCRCKRICELQKKAQVKSFFFNLDKTYGDGGDKSLSLQTAPPLYDGTVLPDWGVIVFLVEPQWQGNETPVSVRVFEHFSRAPKKRFITEPESSQVFL